MRPILVGLTLMSGSNLRRIVEARAVHLSSPDLLIKVAEHFLESTCAAGVHEDDAVGMGRDLRLSAPTISGAALVAEWVSRPPVGVPCVRLRGEDLASGPATRQQGRGQAVRSAALRRQLRPRGPDRPPDR